MTPRPFTGAKLPGILSILIGSLILYLNRRRISPALVSRTKLSSSLNLCDSAMRLAIRRYFLFNHKLWSYNEFGNSPKWQDSVESLGD